MRGCTPARRRRLRLATYLTWLTFQVDGSAYALPRNGCVTGVAGDGQGLAWKGAVAYDKAQRSRAGQSQSSISPSRPTAKRMPFLTRWRHGRSEAGPSDVSR